MTTEKVKRKLTAILSADVKGYSRLMGEDEVGTVRTLKDYRELVSQVIKEYRGRVVDSPGDNLLAEFASVVDAVESAVEIQRQLRAKNAQLPEDRRMEFRIGINLGDVIEEGERIYGDGVNVAARVEGLALPGGVCISGTAYDHVENKVTAEFEYLGEQAVKNIKKPIRVYRVGVKAGASVPKVPSKPKMPEKPSIAVLPFVNMSGDPEQEYFSDGITEDLITDLSKISGLIVIARNSSFTYKGKAVKVNQVGQELAVRYVLEGSVRKAGDRMRITAQLVDATTGGHLWAERYDRELKDIFVLQDEVGEKIVSALAVKLTEDEHQRLERRYTNNLEAYDYFLRALEYKNRFTKEANDQARSMLQRTVDLDPGFAAAYGHMSLTYWIEWTLGWTHDSQCLVRASELAQKAAALDDSEPEAPKILGVLCLWKKQHDQAVVLTERAIALSPNYADAIAQLAHVLAFSGKPEEAIELVQTAMRLNPVYPFLYLFDLGHAYMLAGRYEEAITTLNRVVLRNPHFHPAHIYLAITFGELGRLAEAQAEAEKFVKMTSPMSWEDWRQRLPYKDEAVVEHYFDVLRKAEIRSW